MLHASVAAVAFTAPDVAPSVYYVSPSGSDSSAGSQKAPFATVARCVSVAPKGGSCLLAAGRYEESVVVSRDITIAGAEDGAVLDGSTAINTTWTKEGDSSCVYSSAPLTTEIWQLWADNVPLTPARFPNAKLSDDSVFDGAPFSVSGRKNGSLLYSTRTSSAGHVVEDGAHSPSMASSKIDFTGAIAVLPLGTMGVLTQGVRVASHDGASFRYAPPAGTADKGHANLPFFFEGSCRLLDHEGEWCVDTTTTTTSGDGGADGLVEGGGGGGGGGAGAAATTTTTTTTRRLRVWLDRCADPTKANLRGKVRSYLVNTTQPAGASSVEDSAQTPPPPKVALRGLTLFGGTFSAPRSDVTLERVQVVLPLPTSSTTWFCPSPGWAPQQGSAPPWAPPRDGAPPLRCGLHHVLTPLPPLDHVV